MIVLAVILALFTDLGFWTILGIVLLVLILFGDRR